MTRGRHAQRRAHGAWLSRSSKLAVDGQIEEGQIPGSLCNLKPYSDGPDISESERSFLSDQFSFVPGLTAAGSDDVHGKSSTCGRTKMASQSSGR